MVRPIRPLALSFGLALLLLVLLHPLTNLAATGATTVLTQAPDGLIIETSGSVWYAADGAYWFDAFAPFADRLHLVTRVALEQVLQEHVDVHMADGENHWFDIPLAAPLAEALVVDLQGTSQGASGLDIILYLHQDRDLIARTFGTIGARSLHLDKPLSQTYRVQLESSDTSTYTLRVGAGQSPYLTQPLDAYAFLLVSDSGPLSDREIARIQQFVQAGGNLVVMAQLIDSESWYWSSDLNSLNGILNGCGMQFAGQHLSTTLTTTANRQTLNILTDIRPHTITQGVNEVISTGSTLQVSGAAEGLVFDDQGHPVIAMNRKGRGNCLAIGTGIGFNTNFKLRQNDTLAAQIIEWASVRGNFAVFLPAVLRQ